MFERLKARLRRRYPATHEKMALYSDLRHINDHVKDETLSKLASEWAKRPAAVYISRHSQATWPCLHDGVMFVFVPRGHYEIRSGREREAAILNAVSTCLLQDVFAADQAVCERGYREPLIAHLVFSYKEHIDTYGHQSSEKDLIARRLSMLGRDPSFIMSLEPLEAGQQESDSLYPSTRPNPALGASTT